MNTTTQSFDSMLASLGTLMEGSSGGYGHDAVKQMYRASEALRDTVKAKGAETAEMRAIRIDKGVKLFAKKIDSLSYQISQGYMRGTIALDEAARDTLNLVPNQWAQSVVNTVAQAKEGDRLGILGQIVENGDGPSLAALQAAPEFVTGIDKKRLAEFKGLLEEKHAPEVAAARRQFNEHSDAVFLAKKQAEAIAQKALDVPDFRAALEGDLELQAAELRLAEATAE